MRRSSTGADIRMTEPAGNTWYLMLSKLALSIVLKDSKVASSTLVISTTFFTQLVVTMVAVMCKVAVKSGSHTRLKTSGFSRRTTPPSLSSIKAGVEVCTLFRLQDDPKKPF